MLLSLIIHFIYRKRRHILLQITIKLYWYEFYNYLFYIIHIVMQIKFINKIQGTPYEYKYNTEIYSIELHNNNIVQYNLIIWNTFLPK